MVCPDVGADSSFPILHLAMKMIVVSWICPCGVRVVGLAVRRVNPLMSVMFGKSFERLGAHSAPKLLYLQPCPGFLYGVFEKILQAAAGCE